jgi:hypothetical protein
LAGTIDKRELKSSLPTIEEIERELDGTNFATPVAKLAEVSE